MLDTKASKTLGAIVAMHKKFPKNVREKVTTLRHQLMLRVQTQLQKNEQRWIIIELLALVAMACLYATPVLDFRPSLVPRGNEYPAHVAGMVLIRQWISGTSAFPLWNPAVGFGRSFIADPFLFIYNPFISLPMLIWGVIQGGKVAIASHFLIAGLGTWLLCRELGLRRLSRIWCALMYMLSGGIVSHLPVGQIQLAFALAWLPWSIAGFFWIIRRKNKRSIVAAALVNTLFFFCGNLYIQVYAFFCLLILALVYAMQWDRLRLRKTIAVRLLLFGILTLGLMSIQLVPLLAARDSIHNLGGYVEDELEFPGSQTPTHALLNYLVSEREFVLNEILGKVPYFQESYRYISIYPFLLLLFLVPSFLCSRKRSMIAFTLCFLLMLAWASLGHSFVKHIYALIPTLYQFRFPLRALSVGGLFVIMLSGFGFDYLLDRLGPEPVSGLRNQSPSEQALHVGLLLSIILIFSGGLLNTYRENQELIDLELRSTKEVDTLIQWLLKNKPEEIVIGMAHPIGTYAGIVTYENGLRSLDIIDGWHPADAPVNIGHPSALERRPDVIVNWNNDQPAEEGYQLAFSYGSMQIWVFPDPYPYASLLDMDQLLSNEPIPFRDIKPVPTFVRLNPNHVAVILETQDSSMLVVRESYFSGWSVRVDGEKAELLAVSNHLAVQLEPGAHEVRFSYAPRSFYLGLGVTSLTVLVLLGILPFSYANRHSAPDEPDPH